MGKQNQRNLLQQQSIDIESGVIGGDGYGVFCRSCSVVVSRISKNANFKCLFILILSFCLLISAVFWILPSRTHTPINSFDAANTIKQAATIQANFRLQKSVSQLFPLIAELEYDIYGEIGTPNTEVAILSMHPSSSSNWTDVVFGVLSDPINSTIDSVSLSLLRSSLVELFLKQTNLTVTNSTFGQSSTFEILKFPGGITIIPTQFYFTGQMPEILFNFTLNNSISEILGNFVELKNQLRFGLHLLPYENVFVQITNAIGSTVDLPVVIQASVLSDLGSLQPQRLRQLAQAITDFPDKNLGLDNSVFGNVRSVILSTYFRGELPATAPVPSPAPSPELIQAEPSVSPYPSHSPSISPASSPSDYPHVSAASPGSIPPQSFPPVNSPPAPVVIAKPPQPCPHFTSSIAPSSPPSHSNPNPNLHPVSAPTSLPLDLSPSPGLSFTSSPGKGRSVSSAFAPSSLASSPASAAVGLPIRGIWFLGFSGLLTFYFLCYSS